MQIAEKTDMTTEKEEQYGVKPPRVAVFIDGSNLYHSLEENCRRFDLDFRAFAEKLCRGRPLFRVYYYNVLRDPDRNPQAYQDQQKFLTALSTPHIWRSAWAARR